MRINRGLLTPHFINVPDKAKCELMNPYILMIDRKLMYLKDILPLLQLVSEEKRSLLIICDDLADEALATVLHNKNRGALIVGAIKCGEIGARRKMVMDDLATICGGTFITEDMGIKPEKVSITLLGQASRVSIDRHSTLIAGGFGDTSKVEELAGNIKSQLADTTDEDEKAFLRTRLAKVKNGVAILKIGGVTPIEIEEKKDRIDDALRATRCAVEEGVVAGGGATYLQAIHKLNTTVNENPDIAKGYEIVKKAIAAPFRQMLTNGGSTEKQIDFAYESILSAKYGIGYNQNTESVEDLLKAGVLDPAMVARVALESAASISGTVLLTECVISDVQ
jgi:chaperonin GroEL